MNDRRPDPKSDSSPAAIGRRPGPSALAVAALLLATTLAPAAGAQEGDLAWSYSGDTGPEHWATLAPGLEICARGQMQSPIDIAGADLSPYVPLAFHYRSQNLEAVNDGHGTHLLSQAGSELRIRGEGYRLEEIHFHVPGEHRINGSGAPAEIHLMHRDAEGRLLIVAVPVNAGDRGNTTLSRIVERLPLRPGQRVYYGQVGINPLFILPTGRSYFSYTGSLATPPCSEPVSWIVMAQPVELEPAMLERLARTTGQNARPLQPLNGRPVYLHLQHP